MAVYRQIQTCFWQDTKILDDMDCIERYFYLYLLTNPHLNQTGCFEISTTQIVNETGIEKQKVNDLLKKFEDQLNLIKYSKETKEILIVNFYKYNWTNSPKVKSCIEKEIYKIKSEELIGYIKGIFKIAYHMDTETQEKEKEKEKQKEKKEEKENKNKKKNNYYYNNIIDNNKNNKDPDFFKFIENEFARTLSSTEVMKFEEWRKIFDDDIIKCAIQKAVLANVRKTNYVIAILKNWKSEGIINANEIIKKDISKEDDKKIEIDPKILEYDWLGEKQ